MRLLHALRFPYPRYALIVVRNSAILWLLVRLLLAVPAPVGPGVLLPPPGATALVAAVLVWLDARRFHEHLFHANLGASQGWTLLIALGVAGALDTLTHFLLSPHVA